MKKILVLLIVMASAATLNAQKYAKQSLEMAAGSNVYTDKLGTSKSGLLVSTSYRYMFTPSFGLRAAWQFDVTKSKEYDEHPECEYAAVSHHFRVEGFKRLARFGRFTVNGTAGVGATFYYMRQDARERVFNYTASGSLFYSLGYKDNPWGFLKAEYRVIANNGQSYTLNRAFETTSAPIQAVRRNISLGFGVYLDNASGKRHGDWYKKRRKKRAPKTEVVNNYIDIDTTIVKKQYVAGDYVVLFQEGKTRIQDHQLVDIYKAVEFLKSNPEHNAEIIGGACTNQGSYERNLTLSQERARAVYNKMVLMGVSPKRLSHRGTGNGNGYDGRSSDIQKRVDIEIYK